MATAPCPSPFPFHAASPSFSAAASYPPPPARNSPIPTQTHGYHPSPFPFFSPPPQSAPTPTPFTAPSAFGAPASGSPPIPSPLAYPSACTAAPGVSPAPAYPYAAPFLYPPPPSGAGFSPAPMATMPFTFPTTAPACGFFPPPPLGYSNFPSPIPTQIDPHQIHHHHHFERTPDHLPVQAATQIAVLPTPTSTQPEVSSAAAYQSAPSSAQPWVASSPSPRLDPGRFCLSQPAPARKSPTSTPCDDHSVFPNTTSPVVSSTGLIPQASTLSLLESTEAQASAEATISEHMPRAVLDIKRRLEEHQAQSQRSFDSLQGELSKLRVRLSSLATSIVPWSASSTTTAPPSTTATSAPSVSAITATASVAREMLYEMPQQYDFHNLSRKTVLLSDGSEHSYFALPENYPLERAVPEPVFNVYDDDTEGCSSKSVDVFAGTPGQQTHEEDPLENEKLAKSFHKASENAFSEQLLRYIVKALETEQTSAYVLDYTFQRQQQNAEKTSTTVQQLRDQQLNVLVIHKRRKEWDPGAPAFLVTPLTNDSSNYFPSHDNAHQFMLEKPPAKPPDRFGIADSSLQVILLEVQKSEKSSAHTHFNFLCRNSKQFSAVQAIQDICVLLEAIPSLKRSVFNLVHSSETPIKLLIFIEQPSDLKHFMDQFLLQCHSCCHHSCCHTQSAFPNVQNCCLPIFLACPYFKPVHQLVCYSRMFSSTRAIISVLCMSTDTTLCMILVLSSGKIAQERKDEAAVYKVLILKLPMREISHVWDPGIESILVFYKWLHIQIIQLVHCSAQLAPTQITAYCPSNVEFLHQQCVKKSYNAKNLLSSPNYLQILTLDILFITFLPP